MIAGEDVTEESSLKHKLLKVSLPPRCRLCVLRSPSLVSLSASSPPELALPRPELGEVQYRSRHKTFWLSNFRDPSGM